MSDWMHLHTFVDLERKRSKNGDDVVEHDVIQITGDPSTERTAPPRSTHVRDGRRLLLLDPARGKERLRKTAPPAARRRGDGGEAVLRQGFAELYGGGGGVGGEREAPGAWVWLPSLPPLYIGSPRGGAGPRRWDLLGGRRPRGWSAPQGKWRRPLP